MEETEKLLYSALVLANRELCSRIEHRGASDDFDLLLKFINYALMSSKFSFGERSDAAISMDIKSMVKNLSKSKSCYL